jgi:hypothetical protein
MKDAENDLTGLRMKRWRHHINSREVWASVVKGAKVLKWSWNQKIEKELCH